MTVNLNDGASVHLTELGAAVANVHEQMSLPRFRRVWRAGDEMCGELWKFFHLFGAQCVIGLNGQVFERNEIILSVGHGAQGEPATGSFHSLLETPGRQGGTGGQS